MHKEYHIRSAKFPLLPDEEAEVINPGTFGKALAEYLKTQLEAKGYEVPFICCEDFGWWTEVNLQPVSVGIACRRSHEDPGPCDFAVAIDSDEKRWSWRTFRKVDLSTQLEQLAEDLRAVFEHDPEIEVIALNFDAFGDG